jgi:hypothetical protein
MAKTGGPKKRPGETKAEVKRLVLADISPRAIALTLGISTQAVYLHIQSLRAAGELPEPQEASA